MTHGIILNREMAPFDLQPPRSQPRGALAYRPQPGPDFPWSASSILQRRIVTMNPFGQFHVAYATRICPDDFGGSWKASTRISALLCLILFAACSRRAPEISSPEASPRIDAAAQSGDPAAPAKSVESAEVRQAVAEVEKSLRVGSYDEAAARLLKMRISGTRFSDKDAAAYREALQEAYSRAIEAANKGDPRGKTAVEMIRAARAR